MKTYSEIKQVLAITDPHCVIIKRKPYARKWCAYTTCGQWRVTSTSRADAVSWGRYSQAEILKKFVRDVNAYCGRTGKRLA